MWDAKGMNETLTNYGYSTASDATAYVSTMSTGMGVVQTVCRRLIELVDLRRLSIMVVVVMVFLFVLYIVSREIAFSLATQNSRCYKIKQQFSHGSAVSAIISKNSANLMAVSYDLRAKMANTGCLCKSGNTMNALPFWRYDFKTKRVTHDTLNCMCDINYTVLPGEFTVAGDDQLANFMYTGSTDDAKKVFGAVQK